MSRKFLISLSINPSSPLRVGLRRIWKFLLYIVGVALFAIGLLGITLDASSFNNMLHDRLPGFVAFLEILVIIIYTYCFFRWRFRVAPLRLRKYFLWLIIATAIGFMPVVLLTPFFPSSNSDQTPAQIFVGAVVSFYGVLLLLMAHMKPSLRQQVDENVQRILYISSDKQMILKDLVENLQKMYNCSEEKLYHIIYELKYLDVIDDFGTDIKLCKLKGVKEKFDFPQISSIFDDNIKSNIKRGLNLLNEDMVDIGLFLLGREFETVLKAYLTQAYTKGELATTPGGKDPSQLKLVEMIACLKNNSIVSDEAALSYLRQSRNDRAHGSTPTLAERRLLMNNVQFLANLYIDYIKLFDDLIYKLK